MKVVSILKNLAFVSLIRCSVLLWAGGWTFLRLHLNVLSDGTIFEADPMQPYGLIYSEEEVVGQVHSRCPSSVARFLGMVVDRR